MDMPIILNDPPYGTERCYNGLRLAKALGQQDHRVSLFLLADAASCAKAGQQVPQGFYNLELMLGAVLRRGEVLVCGTCLDAHGLPDDELIEGAQRSTMDELARRTAAADRMLVF
jgi:uncharacterized protein involved in oxidation of intracellular sulfur